MFTSPPRSRPLSRLGLLFAAGTLAVGACSSSGASNPTSSEPDRVISVPTTTSTTPTTSGTDSDPEDPVTSETTPEDTEAAVREVHTRFMTELFARDEREVGPEAILILAEELTTGRVLARLRDSAADQLESGERTAGAGYESNITRVEVADDSAVVLDCSRDLSIGYSASGEPLNDPDPTFTFRETWLVRLQGSWLIEEFIVGGDIPCVPPVS